MGDRGAVSRRPDLRRLRRVARRRGDKSPDGPARRTSCRRTSDALNEYVVQHPGQGRRRVHRRLPEGDPDAGLRRVHREDPRGARPARRASSRPSASRAARSASAIARRCRSWSRRSRDEGGRMLVVARARSRRAAATRHAQRHRRPGRRQARSAIRSSPTAREGVRGRDARDPARRPRGRRDRARTAARRRSRSTATIWEAWYDLGVIAWQGGRRRRGDRRLHARRSRSTRTTRRRCSRAPRRTAAPATRRTRAPTTRPRSRRWTRTIRTARDAAARLASLLRDTGDFDDAVDVLRDTVRVSGANAKIYTELGQIYIAQKRLELAQLVLAKARRARREGSRRLQRARAARAAPGQGAGGVRAVRPGRVARRQLHRRAVQQGVRAARRRRLRASQGRARRRSSKSDRTTTRRRSRSASRTAGSRNSRRRRRSWERVIKEAPKRSTRARRRDVEPRDPRSSTSWRTRAGGKADLERYLQEAPTSHAKRQDAENKCKEVKCS